VAPFRSERQAAFAEPPEVVWAALSDVGAYRRWWPWLTELDAAGFEAGATWRCRVRPPLPYSLRFTVTLEEVDGPSYAVATVAGDIEGHASLDLAGRADGGTDLRLASVLQSSNASLRLLADLGPPIVRFGHDWILDTGLRQFRRRALGPGGDGERKP
jgi:uncharacterized protein YndB with AHSA1/START domain